MRQPALCVPSLSIKTAAEQFFTKVPQQHEGLIRLVMEGPLRGIIGLSAGEADRERAGDGGRSHARHPRRGMSISR